MGRAFDRATRFCLALSCAGIVGIVVLYSIEVVRRYFFNAPSTWISDVVTYLQCALVFLALPLVTRMGEHIRLDFGVPGTGMTGLRALLCDVLSILVCCIAAYFSLRETLRQFDNGITTMSALAVPQWMVSGFIGFGLIGAALAFAGNIVDRARAPRT